MLRTSLDAWSPMRMFQLYIWSSLNGRSMLSKSVLPMDDVRLQLQTVSIGRSSLSRNLWFYRKLPVLAARLKPTSFTSHIRSRFIGTRSIVRR